MRSQWSRSGFTLMEVLVATVIVGMALGVAIAGIAQGHRVSFRASQAKKAAVVAEEVLHLFSDQQEPFSDSEGRSELVDGWGWYVETVEPAVNVTTEDGVPVQVDLSGIEAVRVGLRPPSGAAPFQLYFLTGVPE